MTSGTRTEVRGAEELAASLARVANELEDLHRPAAAAGQVVKQRAAGNAPVSTGALAGSIRAEAIPSGVAVSSSVAYAGVTEYGGGNNIPAQPFMRPALEDSAGEVLELYADETDRLLNTVKGA